MADVRSVLSSLAQFRFEPSPNIQDAAVQSAAGADEEIRYQTLIEQLPAVIFMAYFDGGMRRAYVSPHIERALGFSQAEWIHDPVRWYHQIHPDDQHRWSTEAAEFIVSGNPLRSVYRVLAKDGCTVWFQCEVKMVRRPDGSPWFIHGVAFDITGVKQSEEALQRAHEELEAKVLERTAELQKANEQLAHANADLEQFAYSVSHDLQEPVRTLSIFGELLERRSGAKLGGETEKIIATMVQAARRMNVLVHDLLAYTRLTNDESEEGELLSVSAALEDVLNNLRALVSESGAQITSDSLPEIRMPRLYLAQLLQNLVSNGIKYRGDAAPRIHISCAARDGEYVFSVRDNGIGIDPEYHETIFGIFKRLHTKEEYSGSGMGLAICRRIVQRCGGRIWVESSPGAGAAFYFAVPRGR